MVRQQLMGRGIKDERVLDAMREVPRHRFVPKNNRPYSYEDRPLQIGEGQTISQPYMVAIMTELLSLKENDRVLEVGTGSGYQTAVLAMLAGEVVTVERNRVLGERAATLLDELGYDKVSVHIGDGTCGLDELAPYDAICVTAAGPSVPASLKDQLAPGGRLVCPVGSRTMQTLIMVSKSATGRIDDQKGIGCSFVPLIGEEGWPE